MHAQSMTVTGKSWTGSICSCLEVLWFASFDVALCHQCVASTIAVLPLLSHHSMLWFLGAMPARYWFTHLPHGLLYVV